MPVPVFILPGNHDPLNAAAVYRSSTFIDRKPAHVHVIENASPVKVADGVQLVGAPWMSKRPVTNPVEEALAALAPANGITRICMAHGAVDRLTPDPEAAGVIALAALERAIAEGKVHFVALGDRHSLTNVADGDRIWYSGTPEATDFSETQAGFALVVELDDSRVSAKEVQIGQWRFIERGRVDLNTSDDVDALRKSLEELENKERTVIRLTLVAVFERPLGPKGDLDGLFAVGSQGASVVEGHVHDPEIDLGLGPPWLASNTVTSGEINGLSRKRGHDFVNGGAGSRPGRMVALTRYPQRVTTIRCAIYTRKSTEEGLQQDFNSLDAQRESGEAYIASQKNEGWVCLPDRYDDGGFTGGNMERPALQRLLAAIRRLDELGWVNKSWTTKKGKQRGGKPFNKSTLFKLLTNVVYLGKVSYRDEVYDGEHEAIVDEDLFRRVQALLRRNRNSGGTYVRNKYGALLKGLVRCTACGCAMSHHFTTSGNKRYRYYVCVNAQMRGWDKCPSPSLPAAELEQFVVDQIRALGQDGQVITDSIHRAQQQLQDEIAGLRAQRESVERRVRRLA